jgi:hypothetical protein
VRKKLPFVEPRNRSSVIVISRYQVTTCEEAVGWNILRCVQVNCKAENITMVL